MKIWVDADACPVAVQDVVIRAAVKRTVHTVFVANKVISLPVSEYLSSVLVTATPDAADAYICQHAQPADLVITQDILLADALVGAHVSTIDLRGNKFTEDNIGDRVSIRNLQQERRDSGQITSGPKPFGDKDKRAFAAAFDRELTKLLREASQS